MSRREFLGMAAAIPAMGAGPSVERPNVLVILSDDQPFYTLEHMEKTLTAFAEGLAFEKAYVTTPLCGPSRVSILTGCLVHNHGVLSNRRCSWNMRKKGWGRTGLVPSLASLGYRCGLIGKPWNDYEETAAWVPPGYTSWISVLQNRDPVRANIYGNVRATKIRRKNETAWLAQCVKNFINQEGEHETRIKARGVEREPWFLMAAVKTPHEPYDATAANVQKAQEIDPQPRPNVDAFDPNKPRAIRATPPLTNAQKTALAQKRRGQLAEILDLDDSVADLLSVVDPETTYVFFLSDNGYFFGEHRMRLKGYAYEEASKTPLLVRGPAVVPGSTGLLAANVDLAPTILELAGGDTSPESLGYEMDGRSLVGPMFSEAEARDDLEWRSSLMLEMARLPESAQIDVAGWEAVRTEDSLYVEHRTGETELYDLANDPYQLTNIAPEYDAPTLSTHSQNLSGMKQSSGEALKDFEG